MTDRRSFIRNGSAGLLALFLPQTRADWDDSCKFKGPDTDRSERSWKQIRREFPLQKDPVFMNNGTMGPSPKPVIDAFHDAVMYTNVSAKYGGGEKEAVSALSTLLHCDEEELALTHNVTEGINTAVWGIPLKAGDEVILTDQEHVGNGLPWVYRAKKDRLQIKAISLGKTAEETLDLLKAAVGPKTKVIAVPHIPCTNGQVLPIKDICTFAREKGIYSLIDGAHGTGMMQLNLHDMGCDVYASCCHKWLLAPKGTGYVYVRKEFQETLETLYVGGHTGLKWSVHKDHPFVADEFTHGAHKYYYGTQSRALYMGIEAAVKYHLSIGPERIEARIRELNQYLYSGLQDFGDRIEFMTPEEAISRCGVVSFRFPGKDNAELKKALGKSGFIVRYVPESDLNCMRVSTHIYNSEDEIDTLLSTLKRLAS